MKRLIVILLVLALVFTTGCGKSSSASNTAESTSNQGSSAATLASGSEMVEGYYTTKIETPDWLRWGVFHFIDTLGDQLWMSSKLTDGTPIAACYDTIGDTWEYYAFETGGTRSPSACDISVVDGAVWALYQESYSSEQIKNGDYPDDLKYCVFYINLNTGEKLGQAIPFYGDTGTESSDEIFTGIIAIDENTAILQTPETCYLIDKELNILSKLGSDIGNDRFKIDGVSYVWTQSGYAPLNKASLSADHPMDFDVLCSSNNGHYVVRIGDSRCGYYDPATGTTTELFDWWDVALSSNDARGNSCVFENSNGDFITMDQNGMSKVSKGLVPVKKTLTMACFGDSDSVTNYELVDAIMAFNNGNSGYKIEIKPMSYSTEDERNRLLIELATSTDIDLVDSSMLPDNAINAGVLEDLLTYIDADSDISREDFIQPLLNAMMKDGGLYEYTSKFSMLTVITPAELYPGDENWTAESIINILADNPGQEAYMHNFSRDDIVKLYTWAAIGEFIDWNSNSCSFDSQAFMDWLSLMRDLPVKQEYSGNNKVMLGINYTPEIDVQYLRVNGYDQYVIAGFPESQTNGCYFMKPGTDLNDWMGNVNFNTRIGIMAASPNKEAAWSFVKQLMLGEDEPDLSNGIPVMKASFEKAVDDITSDEISAWDNVVRFGTADAKQFKDAVYSTTKMARIDDKLVELITGEINAYIAGGKTAEETASQIQSRVSIYLAEQG